MTTAWAFLASSECLLDQGLFARGKGSREGAWLVLWWSDSMDTTIEAITATVVGLVVSRTRETRGEVGPSQTQAQNLKSTPH